MSNILPRTHISVPIDNWDLCAKLAGGSAELQHIDPQHPPDKEYRDDCTSDVDDPVGGSFRLAKVEHDGIVPWTSNAPSPMRDYYDGLNPQCHYGGQVNVTAMTLNY